MSISRANAETYLDTKIGTLVADFGLTALVDTIRESAIDESLLALGTPYVDLATTAVADSNASGYRALLYYFGLREVRTRVVQSLVDKSLDGPGMSRRDSQAYANLDKMIAEAKSEALPYATTGPLVDSDGYSDYGAFAHGAISTLPETEF